MIEINEVELEKIKKIAIENKVPIVTDDVLGVIIDELKKIKPTKILEIGTAVGYSAICFARSLETEGRIDTLERDEARIEEAKCNIKKMGLEKNIEIFEGDAVEILPTFEEKYDVVFIDAAKR